MSEDIPTGLMFVDEPDVPEHFNVLLYGPTGSGKSTGAATAQGPIIWLNAEGPNALAYPRKIARTRGTTIHEVRLAKNVDPRPQMRDLIRHIRSGAEPQAATVVVDTVAKLRELLIAKMVMAGAKNTQQQFGDVAKALLGLVTELRDEPVSVVLICHEDIQDEDGERIVRPLIGGTSTEKILSDMDVVAYTGTRRDEETSRVTYIGQLVEGKGRRAKDRSGGLTADGPVRQLDLSEWLQTFGRALGGTAEADLPFSEHYAPADEAGAEHPDAAQGSSPARPEPAQDPEAKTDEEALEEQRGLALELWTTLETPAKARKRVKEAGDNPRALMALVDAAAKLRHVAEMSPGAVAA